MKDMQHGPGASVGDMQDESVISIKDLLAVLWRRLWIILLVMVVLTGTVVGLDLLRAPTYEASIKILVGQEIERGEFSDLGGDVFGLQQLTQSVAVAIPTRPVAEAAIDGLDFKISPDELLGNLTVEQDGETTFLDVSYQDQDPQKAKQIVDAVGSAVSKQVAEVSPSANSLTATVWETAAVPSSPVSPDPLRDGLLALLLGGMLGVGLAFLLEQLDDRWRSPEEVERVSGVPTFGVIPEFQVPKVKKGGR